MAEGWARALFGDAIEAHSAGTKPSGLNPLAVRAMAEVGVDIARHQSKSVNDVGAEFDVVVTVCDDARETCPIAPRGARSMHASFDDPPRLAASAGSDQDAMNHYRRVRDEIRRFVESLPTKLSSIGGTMSQESDQVRSAVREGYSRIAQAGSWNASRQSAASASTCCGGGGCCGSDAFTPDQLAGAIGYASDELANVPSGANMGLSCGNPTALASLKPGEVVVDLGSGGGFDCFVAGAKVGANGTVIGIDMTPEMLAKARGNLSSYRGQTGLSNVEFRLGEIEHLPVADASVDVVISNCVLNLSPDKPQVWREIARVLKPGGRAAISDLALVQPLPEAVRRDIEALVGCVAGAVLIDETRAMASAAGFVDLALTPKPEYIDAMTNWEDPLYRRIVASLPTGSKTSDFIVSLDVSARKALPLRT